MLVIFSGGFPPGARLAELWLTTGGLAFSVFTDIAISAALATYLYRSRNGFRGTHTLVNQLIRYTLHTGAIISVVSVMSLIWSLSLDKHTITPFPGVPYASTYSFALLTNLMSRRELKIHSRTHESIPLPTLQSSGLDTSDLSDNNSTS